MSAAALGGVGAPPAGDGVQLLLHPVFLFLRPRLLKRQAWRYVKTVGTVRPERYINWQSAIQNRSLTALI